MSIEVVFSGIRQRLNPKDIIGEGGEAEIYRLSNGDVGKIFKTPTHLAFTGDPVAQKMARLRIEEHQLKLPAFPQGLPDQVIGPRALITGAKGGAVIGYSMKFLSGAEVLLKYSERKYREAQGISDQRMVSILVQLHELISGIHRKSVIIGDFNDLNVMIDGADTPMLVDADSMQFGKFLSRVFTPRFVDPTHCDLSNGIDLKKPHDAQSDWYAYAVMLMQALLFVGPYGGVHIPKAPAKKFSDSERQRGRMTVFSPEVRYPKAARHFAILPDDLLHRFEQMFVHDERDGIPLQMLSRLRFTACPLCKQVHARSSCPSCQPQPEVTVNEVITNKVEATKIIDTAGRVLYATTQGGVPKYVYNEGNVYKREGATKLLDGTIDPEFRIRISGTRTVIAKGSSVILLNASGNPEHRFAVDLYRGRVPIVDANSKYVFAAEGGYLRRYGGVLGITYAENVGEVLQGQTLLWVSERLGFVFYQAGEITRAHLFNPEHLSIGREVSLPKMNGVLIDATATFSSDHCWFAATTDHQGVLTNHIFMWKSDGTLVGTAQATRGDGSWLENIHGKCATGKLLFAATDDGIVRIESTPQGTLDAAKTYADTARFVDTSTKLLFGSDGIYAVTSSRIWRIRVK